jgi:hypothetical protein
MNSYEIELIHEPSGAYMNFILFSELKQDDIDVAKEVWADMSVIVLDYKEGDE